MSNKEYLLNDEAYRILKWLGLVVIPALATLVGVVGAAWGLPNVTPIVTTINALGVFIGAVIGVSQATVKDTKEDQ